MKRGDAFRSSPSYGVPAVDARLAWWREQPPYREAIVHIVYRWMGASPWASARLPSFERLLEGREAEVLGVDLAADPAETARGKPSDDLPLEGL